MQISCIDNIHQFNRLRKDWEAAYTADPHATIFVSWAWLSGWFQVMPHNWLVLAIRPDNMSSNVAFFPLSVRERTGHDRLYYKSTLTMGGSSMADHTGFVCCPEYEEDALWTFAVYVQQHLEWDKFQMRDVSDPRLALFLKCFSPKKFNVEQLEGTSCPYVPLPNSWDQYLQNFLGPNTRKNLRRSLRQIESLNGFRVTDVEEKNLESQIEALLTLWQMRWGLKSERVLNMHRVIFRRCFENNCLRLVVFWETVTPVAAKAGFIDRQKHTISAYISGFDDKFTKIRSLGLAADGTNIRYAIENGFQVYSFLRGDENHKFSYGAIESFNTNVIVTRRSLRLTIINLIRRIHHAALSVPARVTSKRNGEARPSQEDHITK